MFINQNSVLQTSWVRVPLFIFSPFTNGSHICAFSKKRLEWCVLVSLCYPQWIKLHETISMRDERMNWTLPLVIMEIFFQVSLTPHVGNTTARTPRQNTNAPRSNGNVAHKAPKAHCDLISERSPTQMQGSLSYKQRPNFSKHVVFIFFIFCCIRFCNSTLQLKYQTWNARFKCSVRNFGVVFDSCLKPTSNWVQLSSQASFIYVFSSR